MWSFVVLAVLSVATALEAPATGSNEVKIINTGSFPLLEVQGVQFEPPLDKPLTPGSTLTKIRYGPYKLSVFDIYKPN